jgi:SAM-dependent methyltransferase
MTKPVEHYLEKYKQLHAGVGTFLVGGKAFTDVPGRLFDGSNFYEKLWEDFKLWAKDKDSFRVLDYGCGKAKHLFQPHLEGKTFHEFFAGKVQEYYCYDPGYERYKRSPPSWSTFDAVICADVMEHVPHENVDGVMKEIGNWLHPKGVAFFSISGQLAKKCFDDGENLHVNVQPLEYWQEKLKLMERRYVMVYTADDLTTTIKKL